MERPPLTILELRALAELLAAPGPLTVGELRAALGLELDELTDALERLHAVDLIVRLSDPGSGEGS